MTDFEDGKKEYYSATFTKLDLSQREIVDVEYEECTFNDCNFSASIFTRCIFTNCVFSHSNLSVAKIARSEFRNVEFRECKMIGIDWTKAVWPRLALFSPIKFHKCILNDSSFLGLTLKEIVMNECRAHDVDFRDGNFSGGNFSSTDFTNSLFGKTNLSAADFTDAINYTIDITHNTIKKAKFSRYEAITLLDSLDIELID